jgi:flavin reductase (DIM6/NTAB) family NADH-FMN oxidoreductase RutF
MPDELRFRRVMGNFTTGVAVVTSRGPDGRPCGLTANSVASVSLDPLLVLVCVDREAASHACIVDGGAFALSILEVRHELLARRFSEEASAARFEELDYRTEVTGSPVLADALAWLDCRVIDVHDAGDHSIVVGEVLACDARAGDPLVFFRGEYRRIHA